MTCFGFNSRQKSKSRKLTLPSVLILPFTLQIFAAVASVGYFSFRNGEQTVDHLVRQLASRTNRSVEHHLDTYLADPLRITEATTDAIKSKLLSPYDLRSVQRFLWHQAETTKITYINYGLTDVSYVGVGRLAGVAGHTVSETSARTGGENYNYTVDQQGNLLKMVHIYQGYDHHKESWYQETMQAKRPLWSRVYAWEGEEEIISIAASRPVYDSKQQLVGAVSVDLALSDISRFLQTLRVSPSASIFIIERDGALIASSDHEPVAQLVDRDVKRLNAFESQDPLIRTTAQQIQQAAGDFRLIQTDQSFEFQFDGTDQFVHVTPLRDTFGLNWLVVLRVPKQDFMAQINQNTGATVLLCIAALMIAILTGLFTTQRIMRSIQRLNRASRAIASGELNQTVTSSRIRELDYLSDSFNQMADQLRQSFTELEAINAELENRVDDRTSELKAALADLQQMQAQLIQTEKMSSLGQLVAGVAHEINNPVNFIHGNLTYAKSYTEELLRLIQLYQKHYPQPALEIEAQLVETDLTFLQQDIVKLFQSMRLGTDRIREIVLSLRNFSRLDEAEFKLVNIHEGIDSALLILTNRLKAKPNRTAIQVIKDYGQIPPVECYAGQLNQVFLNLITNAIDILETTQLPAVQSVEPEAPGDRLKPQTMTQSACRTTNAEAAQIQIQTRCLPPDAIEIRITDNGPGISESARGRLFDPFFTTKPIGQGAGLGLSISYQIITEKHHGRLTCTSIPGQGAEFVIQIPVRQVEQLSPTDEKNPVNQT